MITLDASAKVKGDLEDGSWAEVEAVEEDGSFLATEMRIKKVKEEKGDKVRNENAEKAKNEKGED